MTSKLVKEDNEYLYLYQYLHANDDEYPDWQCTPDLSVCPDPKWPDHIILAGLYEVRVDFRIRKSDGHVLLDGVR